MPSALQLPDSSENLLLNSDFAVAQLGTTFTSATTPANSDDTYLLDQWVLLSDGNDIVDVSQETTEIPSGVGYGIKLDVETPDKKFGIIQFLENKRAVAAIGDTVSFSFEAKKVVGNASVDKLRAAVLSWDGVTADTLTSDVVAAWGAEGANPTLVANWTYENTPSTLTLTDSFQRFEIANVAVDTASTKNIAVFIWCDNSDATVGDLVYLSKVKLEITSRVTTYSPKPFDAAFAECQRFLFMSFPYGTAPAQQAGLAGCVAYYASFTGAGAAGRSVFFPTEMLKAPTAVFYNPVNANAKWYNNVTMLDSGDAALVAGISGTSGFFFNNTQVAGDSVSESIFIHFVADARL